MPKPYNYMPLSLKTLAFCSYFFCFILRNNFITFYKQHFFPTQPQCCLTFSWIQFQMLLRCCLLYITIIIRRNILYLAHLFPSPGLVLFMLYLCDPFFIFSLVFIIINYTVWLKQIHLSFCMFLEYLVFVLKDNMAE